MPQITLHLDEGVVAKIRVNAEAKGLSVTDYLISLVRREVGQEWPEGFFDEIIGGWAGGPLERPPQMLDAH